MSLTITPTLPGDAYRYTVTIGGAIEQHRETLATRLIVQDEPSDHYVGDGLDGEQVVECFASIAKKLLTQYEAHASRHGAVSARIEFGTEGKVRNFCENPELGVFPVTDATVKLAVQACGEYRFDDGQMYLVMMLLAGERLGIYFPQR